MPVWGGLSWVEGKSLDLVGLDKTAAQLMSIGVGMAGSLEDSSFLLGLLGLL